MNGIKTLAPEYPIFVKIGETITHLNSDNLSLVYEIDNYLERLSTVGNQGPNPSAISEPDSKTFETHLNGEIHRMKVLNQHLTVIKEKLSMLLG